MNKLYFTNIFWVLVCIKIFFSAFFASHYVTQGFLPFIQYFITTNLNPYDYFFIQGLNVFPYPAGMLLFISPFLSFGHIVFENLFFNTNLSLLLFRIPILVADIVIYIILCKLLPSKENKVLWLYFASPILFYINYFHGQLDVIPTAFLFVSLYFFSLKKYLRSFLFLGIGIAIKTHLFIVLPFSAVYLMRQKKNIFSVGLLSLFSILTFFVVNMPFYTKGYFLSVFNNPEQQRLFFTTFPYFYKDLTVLIAPAALLICFYIFAANKRLNFDSLILTLGLIFTILIALVPPMQGWFYWSVPLLTFFLIKYKDSHSLSFLMMNIFFILFFIFTKDSDIFESMIPIFPALSQMPNPYHFLESMSPNATLIQNILFTCLQVSVAMNAFWCYRLGIFYNNLYIEKQKAFVLGIGGDSGVGKSTLSDGIKDLVGKNQTVVLNGDDSHKWERHDAHWQYFTHLDPKANDIHKDINQIYALIDGKTIERATYNHKTGKFTKPIQIEKDQFILFQGLHPFFLDKMRSIYDLKIFIDAEEKLRKQWKVKRDTKDRGYSRHDADVVIKKRKKDAEKFILPQKKLADWVITYYPKKESVGVKYSFKNSIPLEALVNELNEIKTLTINHTYHNTKMQIISIEGKISRKTVAKIAYKLYPNLNELTGHNAVFRENSQGINQLFFINYLNSFFINTTVSSSEEM